MSNIQPYKSHKGKELLVRDIDTGEKWAGEWIESLYKEKDYITLGYFKDEITGLYEPAKIPINSLKQNMCIYGSYNLNRGKFLDKILLQIIYNDKSVIHFDSRDMTRLINKIPEHRRDDIRTVDIQNEGDVKDKSDIELTNNPIIFCNINKDLNDTTIRKQINSIVKGSNNIFHISINNVSNYISEDNLVIDEQIFEDNNRWFILSDENPTLIPHQLSKQLDKVRRHISLNPGGNPAHSQDIGMLIDENLNVWELADLTENECVSKFIVEDKYVTDPVILNILPEMQPNNKIYN